ncbi:SPOSA6832_02438, partial [Sporobolomyces salmonicolor]
MSKPHKLPTTLVLDFHDSYTRNLLQLVQQLNRLPRSGWDCTGAQERVIVANVDSLSWCASLCACLETCERVDPPRVLARQGNLRLFDPAAPRLRHPGTRSGHPAQSGRFLLGDEIDPRGGRPVAHLWALLGTPGVGDRVRGQCKAFSADHKPSRRLTGPALQVVKAASPLHGQVTRIRHANDPIFAHVPTEFAAVQYNSLVVDPSALPAELEATAWSAGDEVMGLRHRIKPLWGVQFHPESICSTFGARILSNFFELTLAHHGRTTPSPALPSSVLSLSTTAQPLPRPSGTEQPRVGARWEQRIVSLGSASGLLPQQVFEGFVKGRCELGEAWLDSARVSSALSRPRLRSDSSRFQPTGVPQFSHLFNPQATWSYSISQHSLRLCTSVAPLPSTLRLDSSTSVFSLISDAQSTLHRSTSVLDGCRPTIPIGFVGYISYEMKAVTMPLSVAGHARHFSETEHDGVELAFASLVLTFAHETEEWLASGLVRVTATANGAAAAEADGAGLCAELGVDEAEWTAWLDSLRVFFDAASSSPFNPISPAPLPTTLSPDQDRAEYIASIESARRSITAGDAYELCLTTQFRASLPLSSPLVADPYPLYLSLRATNPAPYSAYFHLPRSDLTILSSSPERFLRSSRTGQVCMKPIKGTVRRCPDDPLEDERRKSSLEVDEKERAENLMIVDLIRNDLLGFCQVGSVEVTGLMKIESYETVHQMVTTVVGEFSEGVNPFDAVSQAFPPGKRLLKWSTAAAHCRTFTGSMTGAPKLRSLQLLDELEHSRPRGIYSGVFGYVAVDGASDWSVVIRTLVQRGAELSLGAGGAITHLSDSEKEWEEVLTKTDAVLGKTRL